MEETFYTVDSRSNELVECDEDNASCVLLDIDTYHGLKNALRIVRARSLQQVEKAQADAHGYILLRQERRKYEGKWAWLVTMRTPHSVKMGNAAYDIIKKDLQDFYGMQPFPDIVYPGNLRRTATVKEILETYVDVYENGRDTVKPEKKLVLEWLERSEGRAVLGIATLVANHAVGVFDISYWVTAL